MHEQFSYPEMHTPYIPNTVVCMSHHFPADTLGLVLQHYTDEEDFERWMRNEDLLKACLYTNGILGIYMKKSLKAYLEEGENDDTN